MRPGRQDTRRRYYPSASTAIAASAVTVNAGEERSGVDIPVLYNRAGNIQGTVLSSAPPGAVMISLTAADPTVLAGQGLPTARTTAEGKFTLRNVPPGQYTLNAYTVPAPPQPMMISVNGTMQMTPQAAPKADDVPRLWGRVQVTVDGGQSMQDVSVAMQAGKSISGRVMFDTQVQMDLARTRYMVTLQNAPSPQPISDGPDAASAGPARRPLHARWRAAGPLHPARIGWRRADAGLAADRAEVRDRGRRGHDGHPARVRRRPGSLGRRRSR